MKPEVPAAARDVFGSLDAEHFERVERYVALLGTVGVERGLIGPREAPRLWERHILNCAVLAELVPPGASVLDIGSGAGLPGLVLALRRDDVLVTVLEPLLRRSTFLTEAVSALGLGDQVRVERARAEQLHGTATFDVVTARAVAPLDRLLEWSMPLVAPDGVLLAMKGSTAEAEIEAAIGTLRQLHCAEPEVVELGHSSGQSGGQSTARVVRVAHADPTRVSWRPSTPTKRRRDA